MVLADLTVTEFLDKLGSDSPAPGGGSVAALAGSLGASLCAMVARLTTGKKKYRDAWPDMERVEASADALRKRLLELVEKDTEAYEGVMAAFRLPGDDNSQRARRSEAIETATRHAAQVPLETLRTVGELLEPVEMAIQKGNPNCITDAGVAVQLIRAAAMGAAYNVRINLGGIKDRDFSQGLEKETDEMLGRIAGRVEELERQVQRKMIP